MLGQSQQKLPDDLEKSLLRLVDEHVRGGPPSGETLETLETTARAYGYP
jgi:hypothetical protein